jgi:hypothetical protein
LVYLLVDFLLVSLPVMQSKDETLVPLTINCWPSVSGGQSYVNIEYESTSAFELQVGGVGTGGEAEGSHAAS